MVLHGRLDQLGFDIHPTLQPALNIFYPKLKGRCDSSSQIWVNNDICNNFEWALKILQNLSGVHLLKSISWSTNKATITILCDACLSRMGFWNLTTNQGFILPTLITSTLTQSFILKPYASFQH